MPGLETQANRTTPDMSFACEAHAATGGHTPSRFSVREKTIGINFRGFGAS
jgi:hypothetical protein